MSSSDSDNELIDLDKSSIDSENLKSDSDNELILETRRLKKSLHLRTKDRNDIKENLKKLNVATKKSKEAQYDFIEKLCSRNIELSWKLPPLHELSTQTVRLPEKKIRDKINKLGLPLKRGRFNPDEDKILAKNWKDLCEEFNLPDVPNALTSWRNVTNNSTLTRTRRLAVLWLARGLNDRTPAQVFQRFSHTFGSKVKGRFTQEQLEFIELFLQNERVHKTQQHLATMLGRDERSIYKCIKLIKRRNAEGGKIKKLKWDLQMCELLIKNLILIVAKEQHLEISPDDPNILTKEKLEILKTATITVRNWKALSDATSLPVTNLKKQWIRKIYNQLFSPEPIFTKPIVLKIIKILKRKGYKHWMDVDWKRIAKKFKYLQSTFLFRIYYNYTCRYCKNKMKNLKDTVDYMYDNFIISKEELYNRKLNRLVIINGKLNFLNE